MRIRLLKLIGSGLRVKDEVFGEFVIVWAGQPPSIVNYQNTDMYRFAYISENVAHYRPVDYVTINEGARVEPLPPESGDQLGR